MTQKHRCKSCGSKLFVILEGKESVDVQCHRCNAVYLGFKKKPAPEAQAAMDIASSKSIPGMVDDGGSNRG